MGRLRIVAPLVVSCALLAGCMSSGAKKDIDIGTGRVQAISQSILAAEATAPSPERDAALATLQAQMAQAAADLDAARARGWRDRVVNTAGMVETTAAAGAPIAGMFFPPALVLLGLVGSVAGAIKKKFSISGEAQ